MVSSIALDRAGKMCLSHAPSVLACVFLSVGTRKCSTPEADKGVHWRVSIDASWETVLVVVIVVVVAVVSNRVNVLGGLGDSLYGCTSTRRLQERGGGRCVEGLSVSNVGSGKMVCPLSSAMASEVGVSGMYMEE